MNSNVVSMISARLAAQPHDVRTLADKERDALIVSAIQVDGVWVIKSRYGDDTWALAGGTSNVAASKRVLDFGRLPAPYRAAMKAIVYRYLRRGRAGQKKPGPTSLVQLLANAKPFLRHLDRLKLKHLGAVTPMVCATYVAECKAHRQSRQRKGKPLSPGGLMLRFLAVEALHELSQFTDTPIPAHPWPESSAAHLAGATGSGNLGKGKSKTALIPDEVFTTLFQQAHALVERGDGLLDLRDALDAVAAQREGQNPVTINHAKNHHLTAQGWKGGLGALVADLLALRTACYIVVASLSGCRNHELAFVQRDACYRTEDDDGVLYWWMRSQSTKTGAGHTEWMVSEAAVTALRVINRWALPYQAKIEAEIAMRRAVDPQDPEIATAQAHLRAVFLGETPMNNQVRTLSRTSWNRSLNAFAKRCGLDWHLATHQFRRKFANYAARSKFGDLRYLREHFKHWAQDMTNDSYALNESLEMELYAEIQDELDSLKFGLAEQWLNPAEPLAGGYGKNLVAWRSKDENIAIFKDRATMVRSIADSHAIRGNGHAWCTADDNKCIGNNFEQTRCSGCDNAVIGRFHARMYQQLYNDLKEVAKCDDIGVGGQARVQRDLERCRDVLVSLGYDPEAKAA